MRVQHWIGGALALLVFVGGLVVGFSPQTIDTSRSYDVQCGSPFRPDSSPNGQNEDDYWGDTFGYIPSGPLYETSDDRARLCEIYLSTERTAGMVLAGIGALGLCLAIVLAYRAEGRIIGEARKHQAADENYWRRRGWAPAKEPQSPPPGWVQAGITGADAGTPSG